MIKKLKIGTWVFHPSTNRKGRIRGHISGQYVSIVFDCENWDNFKSSYAETILRSEIILLKGVKK